MLCKLNYCMFLFCSIHVCTFQFQFIRLFSSSRNFFNLRELLTGAAGDLYRSGFIVASLASLIIFNFSITNLTNLLSSLHHPLQSPSSSPVSISIFNIFTAFLASSYVANPAPVSLSQHLRFSFPEHLIIVLIPFPHLFLEMYVLN